MKLVKDLKFDLKSAKKDMLRPSKLQEFRVKNESSRVTNKSRRSLGVEVVLSQQTYTNENLFKLPCR